MFRGVATKASAEYTLGQSAVGWSCPVDTTEDTLVTITIPGGTIGANGTVRIWTTWTFTNSANNKTLRIRYSGGSGTIYMTATLTAATTYTTVTTITNRNATNSQVSGATSGATGGVGSGSSGVVTSAVDTTADTTIVLTGQKALGSETLTLERYIVEILP